MKAKLYLVTDIQFDITDGGNAEDEWTDEEYKDLVDSAIGLWYAEDEITYVIRSQRKLVFVSLV